MSCRIISSNGNIPSYNIKEFILSIESDVELLPTINTKGKFIDDDTTINNYCGIGSTALVCETSDVYILSPDNKWVKL